MKLLCIRIAARAASHRSVLSFSIKNVTTSSLIRSQGLRQLSPHIISSSLFSTSTKESITTSSWVESSYVPAKIRPYLYLARVDKPVGTLLLLWPCCWSVALAAPLGTIPDLLLMSKFALGAFIMRGAGCTINDLWDQDFDRQVERTKTRPLASGMLSTKDGLRFLALQLSAGLGVLLTFNSSSIAAGLLSMPLVISYPLMKRFTYWPQFVLGLTFNWGVWVGWTAVYDSVAYEQLLPLYGAGVCWTLVYDTIYGYQDRKDDAKIGDRPQIPLSVISCGMLGGLLATGLIADLSAPFYIGTTGIWGHVLWQIWTADVNNPQNLWKRFSSNIYTGAAVTAAIVAGHF